MAVAAARAAPSRAQLLYPSGVDLRDDGAAEDDQCVGDQRFEFVLAGVDRNGGDERAVLFDVPHDELVVGDAPVRMTASTRPHMAAAMAPICFEMP